MANNQTRNAQKKSDDGKTPPARRESSKSKQDIVTELENNQ